MSIFKQQSGNPVLRKDTFKNFTIVDDGQVMTIGGTMQKLGLLLLLVIGAATYTWVQFSRGADVTAWMIGGAIGGFVLAIIQVFKMSWSPWLAPAYAVLEGLFLGAISAMYNAAFAETMPNIIFNAVGLTFCTAVGMYGMYHFRIIKVTQKFRTIIVAATIGIALFYLVTLALRFFNVPVSFMHDSSMLGIGISVFIVAIAALNLLLDFDFIERGAAQGAPKFMEWFGAFSLLVTLVWLYLEILRLLSRLSSRD